MHKFPWALRNLGMGGGGNCTCEAHQLVGRYIILWQELRRLSLLGTLHFPMCDIYIWRVYICATPRDLYTIYTIYAALSISRSLSLLLSPIPPAPGCFCCVHLTELKIPSASLFLILFSRPRIESKYKNVIQYKPKCVNSICIFYKKENVKKSSHRVFFYIYLLGVC